MKIYPVDVASIIAFVFSMSIYFYLFVNVYKTDTKGDKWRTTALQLLPVSCSMMPEFMVIWHLPKELFRYAVWFDTVFYTAIITALILARVSFAKKMFFDLSIVTIGFIMCGFGLLFLGQ